MEDISLLKFFSERKEVFEKHFVKRVYKKDEIIFKEGTIGDSFFLIEKGSVIIEKSLNPENTEFKELAILSEADFFGEIAVIEERARTAQARALEECILYEIKREDFFKFISDFPEDGTKILLYIMKLTFNRLHHTSKELTLLFDISRLLTKPYVEEKEFLKEIVDEVSLYFEGDWNIYSYFYNYFNEEFEKAGENCEFQDENSKLKPEKTGWIDDNTYCIVALDGNNVMAYLIFKSKEKLSISQKNDWSTIFDTISFIVSAELKEIKVKKELAMIEKLKNRKNLI